MKRTVMKRTVVVLAVILAAILPAQTLVAARATRPSPRTPTVAPDAPSPGATAPGWSWESEVPRPRAVTTKPAGKPAGEPAAEPAAPAAPTSDDERARGRLIEVSIAEQQLTAWRDGRMIMRFKISTGMRGYDTPTGRYRITWKNPNAWSRPWHVWMPWAMQWNGNYMLHQLTHKPGSDDLIGEDDLGKRASHGCIRIGPGDAERLYRWAVLGTAVWVHA